MDDRLSTFSDGQLTDIRSKDFMRLISALAFDDGGRSRSLSNQIDLSRAVEHYSQRWPHSLSAGTLTKNFDRMLATKSAVNPGSTLEPSWAAPLAVVRPLAEAFIDVARPASLIGKLLRLSARVPFNVSVPTATTGGTYRWVGQGAPKPVGNMQLGNATLTISKASGLIVITDELLRLSAPASVDTLRRELITGMSQYLDQQVTDPTVAAVAGVSPASITNGAPSIGSAGSSAANAVTDIKALIAAFIAANPNAASIAILMSPAAATAMAIATNSTTLGPNGGALFGVPVLTGAIGSRVVVLDPTALLIADDGELDVTISRQGTVEMDTLPTSPPTAGTVMVSLWQLGLVGLKIDRFIEWRMARANAVMYTNVAYV